MFQKLVDLLKEVFWIKSSRKKTRPARKVIKKTSVKKKVAKKKLASPQAKPEVKSRLKVKQPPKSVAKVIDPALVEIGLITHYFDRIKVCVVKVTHGSILIGDKLTILGEKTKFVQKVWSLQIESQDVKVAKKGQIIGLKVDKMVVVGDKVYK